MTVEFVPNSSKCFEFGVSNGTWFTLANTSGITKLIANQQFNDSLVINSDDAKKCAEVMRDWEPPSGWFRCGDEVEGKQMFIDFFETCDGFSTY